MVDADTAKQLIESGLTIWPENPNLLIVRGWDEKRNKEYARALNNFLKALKYRPDDPVLHSMLAETYGGLGLTQNAEKHHQLAKAAKAREQETQQAKTAAPVVVSGPAPGK